MNEHVRIILQHLPFIGLAVGHETPLFTRLAEAAIIGAIVLYGSVQIIGAKVDALGADFHQVVIEQRVLDSRLRRVERISAVNRGAINDLVKRDIR